MDERAVTKPLRTKFDGSCGDVKLCFDGWATRMDKPFQFLCKGHFSDKGL